MIGGAVALPAYVSPVWPITISTLDRSIERDAATLTHSEITLAG